MQKLSTDAGREALLALISSTKDHLDRAQKLISSYKITDTDTSLWLRCSLENINALKELQEFIAASEAEEKASAVEGGVQ